MTYRDLIKRILDEYREHPEIVDKKVRIEYSSYNPEDVEVYIYEDTVGLSFLGETR
jgi:hypothetical protein